MSSYQGYNQTNPYHKDGAIMTIFMNVRRLQCMYEDYSVCTKTTVYVRRLQCMYEDYNVCTKTTMYVRRLQCMYEDHVTCEDLLYVGMESSNVPLHWLFFPHEFHFGQYETSSCVLRTRTYPIGPSST